MEKRVVVASILLVLLLQAGVLLVAGQRKAAASSSDMDAIIRLPSSDTKIGSADKATSSAMARPPGNGRRPWKCCTLQLCTLSWPPICVCHDEVAQCSDACEDCEEVEGSGPTRYVCKDTYRGDPALPCWGPEDQQGNKIVHRGIADKDAVATLAREAAAAAWKEHDEEEKRLSTAAASSSSSSSDTKLLASADKATTTTAGNGERPWECCTVQICAFSWPPTCYCQDEVEQCSDACNKCEEVEGSDPTRYVCKDSYQGEPALPCWGSEHHGNKIVHDGGRNVGARAAAVVGRRALG